MLEADPNFKSNVTICQSIAKMFALYHNKLYDEKKAALFKLLLISFFTKKWNTLILNVANVLDYNVLNKK